MNHVMLFAQTYLVNSVWQAPLVFAAAWLIARLLSNENPALRHRIWVAALLLQCTLPACQLPLDLRSQLAGLLQHGSGADASVKVSLGTATALHSTSWAAAILPVLTVVYGCVLAIAAVRLVVRLRRVTLLRRSAYVAELPQDAADVLTRCSRRLGIREVSVALSEKTFGPATLGVAHPVVLLPSQMVAVAPAADLHCALAHELAHVHRRDYLKNLVYEVVSLPVAYHPAVWLTRANVTETREEICDALAAGMLTGGLDYARSLLRLAAMMLAAPPARKSHAIGIFDAHPFERRIMQLTTRSIAVSTSRRVITFALCAGTALLTCGSAVALHWQSAQPVAASETASNRPVKIQGGVMAGTVVHKTMPVYPPEAKEAKIQGQVVLRAIISKTGAVESLQVVSGPEELRRSAVDAVSHWVYQPYLLNGQPTEVDTTVTVTYSFSK